jgi:hypothetical protein
MLDVRGMDRYVVKTSFVAAPTPREPAGSGDGPEARLSYQRSFRDSLLQAALLLKLPPEASVSEWLKVIQAQYEGLKD